MPFQLIVLINSCQGSLYVGNVGLTSSTLFTSSVIGVTDTVDTSLGGKPCGPDQGYRVPGSPRSKPASPTRRADARRASEQAT